MKTIFKGWVASRSIQNCFLWASVSVIGFSGGALGNEWPGVGLDYIRTNFEIIPAVGEGAHTLQRMESGWLTPDPRETLVCLFTNGELWWAPAIDAYQDWIQIASGVTDMTITKSASGQDVLTTAVQGKLQVWGWDPQLMEFFESTAIVDSRWTNVACLQGASWSDGVGDGFLAVSSGTNVISGSFDGSSWTTATLFTTSDPIDQLHALDWSGTTESELAVFTRSSTGSTLLEIRGKEGTVSTNPTNSLPHSYPSSGIGDQIVVIPEYDDTKAGLYWITYVGATQYALTFDLDSAEPPQTLGTDSVSSCVLLDWNADNYLDMVIALADENVNYILLNDSGGTSPNTFVIDPEESRRIVMDYLDPDGNPPSSSPLNGATDLLTLDLDHDGDRELVAARSMTADLWVMMNERADEEVDRVELEAVIMAQSYDVVNGQTHLTMTVDYSAVATPKADYCRVWVYGQLQLGEPTIAPDPVYSTEFDLSSTRTAGTLNLDVYYMGVPFPILQVHFEPITLGVWEPVATYGIPSFFYITDDVGGWDELLNFERPFPHRGAFLDYQVSLGDNGGTGGGSVIRPNINGGSTPPPLDDL